jgi:aryl-alcohol dehydrogenase-like predicted oxidoreductase
MVLTNLMIGFGSGELQLGEALRRLNVPREQLVITTKIYWSSWNNMPNQNGLSRKHIIEGMKNSIKRLGLSYVDVVFSHRPDY